MGNIPYAAGNIDYTVWVPRGEHTPWVTSNTPWELSRGTQVYTVGILRGEHLYVSYAVGNIRRGEHVSHGVNDVAHDTIPPWVHRRG